MLTVTSDASSPEQFTEAHLSGRISAGSNGCHDTGPNCFWNVVHTCAFSPLTLGIELEIFDADLVGRDESVVLLLDDLYVASLQS